MEEDEKEADEKEALMVEEGKLVGRMEEGEKAEEGEEWEKEVEKEGQEVEVKVMVVMVAAEAEEAETEDPPLDSAPPMPTSSSNGSLIHALDAPHGR